MMESPQQIGKFRVLRLLGEGAMGRVFLAEDPLIDRQVAIKVMSAEGDDEARERFRNEARAAGQMSHPNIVQLFEFGFHEGQPYLVMEYLVGESVDVWLAREPPLKARLSVLLDLCQAIGHAHSRGVLHRDVKPANLQVLPEGTCKLVDFGIARSRSVRLTATGMILGTPEFIAPEVLQDAGYSPRSDLFAVALVAYQTLAGVNPFRAETLEGCLTRVLTHEPPPLAEVCADVPAELSEAIASYLSKDPDQRPADVRPLTAALARLRDRTLRLSAAPPLAPAPEVPIPEPGVDGEAPTLRSDVSPAPLRGDVAPPPARGRRRPAVALLAAGAVVALVAAATFWRPWSGPVPVAELTPAPAGVPAAEGTGPETDDVGAEPAGEPETGGSSPTLRPTGPGTDPTHDREADGGLGPVAGDRVGSQERDPGARTAQRPIAPPPETAPEEVRAGGPSVLATAAASEPGAAAPPARGAGESQVESVEPGPAADPDPGEEGDPASPPPARDAPQEELAREPSAGPTSVGDPEPPTPEPDPPPRIDGLEPMVVRRGSTTALRITGQGFGPEAEVVIRRGGRPVRALRILRSQVEGESKLRVTLLVGRQIPLGTYAVIVVDAGGRESNPIGLEVGL